MLIKTVKEVSRISGISVRTLHYYDEIGLLKPTAVTEAGYRLYDDAAVARLHDVLTFRTLGFSLNEIRSLLDGGEYEKTLKNQLDTLTREYEKLGHQIERLRNMIEKGENQMNFSDFSKEELDALEQEAKEKWGKTDAYREYEARGKNADIMPLFAGFGSIRNLPPGSAEAQTQVKLLQDFITENYYTCTPEILRSLGETYVADDRFRENIDRAGGDGTAAFVRDAIREYCK